LQISADEELAANARENTRIIFVSGDHEIHVSFSTTCPTLIPHRSDFFPLFSFYLRLSA